MQRHVYTISRKDVDKNKYSADLNCHLRNALVQFLDRVIPGDVGKRIYLITLRRFGNIYHIENQQQYEERLK
jgi:hypothetical protein